MIDRSVAERVQCGDSNVHWSRPKKAICEWRGCCGSISTSCSSSDAQMATLLLFRLLSKCGGMVE